MGDPQRLVDSCNLRDRDRGDPALLVRPLVTSLRRRLDLERRQLLAHQRREAGGGSVDDQEVEPVTDSEPIEADADQGARLLMVGTLVQVEDAAALGMRERAHALLGSKSRQRGRRGATAAQDDQRHESRQRDERPGALPIRGAHETDRRRRQSRPLERRTKHIVDERRHRPQRGAARAEHPGVAALQQLSRDVDRNVGPRFEVRADDADRDPPLGDEKTVGQRPRGDLALERR